MAITLLKEMDRAQGAEFLEDRFSGYLLVPPAAGADPDLKATYNYDPFVFGERFPALSVEEAPMGGDDVYGKSGPYVMNVRVYFPSLYGTATAGVFNVDKDARAEAKRLTRRVFSRWHAVLEADRDLRAMVRNIRLASIEAGDADRLGNFRLSETGRTVLWAHVGRVEVLA